jgi:prevent-host-death family protein
MLIKTEAAMAVTTMSSREFNQDTSRAKKAAATGPVFITDRGRPAHVLLSIEEYRKLAGKGLSLLEAVAQTGAGADIEVEFPRFKDFVRTVDFD